MSDEIKKILGKKKHSLKDVHYLEKRLNDDSAFLLDCSDEVFDSLVPKISESKLQESKNQFLEKLLNSNTSDKFQSPILEIINSIGKTVFSSSIPKFGYAGVSKDELRDLAIPQGILAEENSLFTIRVNRENDQYLDISLKNLDYAIYLSLQVKVFFEDGDSISLTSKNKRNISRPWKINKKPVNKVEIYYQDQNH
ncbi:hypothetical protein [Candidatus Uabimicrobium sp. HlEnr_7]|uniref:hypothetical protein n=1 Tax=Candidatus Uabimicrobium helgolandensis TaxID=3095367 RepID=UPI003556DA04